MSRLRRWASGVLIIIGVGLLAGASASVAGGNLDESWAVAIGAMLIAGHCLSFGFV